MSLPFDPPTESLTELLHELEKARLAVTGVLFSSSLGARDVPPESGEEVRELASLLRRARMAMLQSPAGARAVVGLLVDEGRKYADTEEGAEWQQRLLASQELEPLRDMWEAISLSVYDDLNEDADIPTAWLDLVSDVAASSSSMEALIKAMRPEGVA